MIEGPNKESQRPLGIWLDLVRRIQEAYAGTPEGVARACTTNRIGERDGWKVDEMLGAQGTAHSSRTQAANERMSTSASQKIELRHRFSLHRKANHLR